MTESLEVIRDTALEASRDTVAPLAASGLVVRGFRWWCFAEAADGVRVLRLPLLVKCEAKS